MKIDPRRVLSKIPAQLLHKKQEKFFDYADQEQLVKRIQMKLL
jgi:hypothetical protein